MFNWCIGESTKLYGVHFFVTEGRLYQVISLETQHNMMSASRRSGKALRILLLSSFLLRSNVQGYI